MFPNHVYAVKKEKSDNSFNWGSKFIDRHPVFANVVIIIVITLLCIYAAYLATALFTKHGRSCKVPGVENMSYTEAVSLLHSRGLKVDIRDSIYKDDVKPGFVIEQFPKANSIVKPGRKIFLYINAVHPKEVILDDDNHPAEYALRGSSYRSTVARLEELGFKHMRVVRVLGTTDRVVKIIANGRPVRKMQKVPVNAVLTIEVADGRLADLKDSLQNLEYLQIYNEQRDSYTPTEEENSYSGSESEESYTPASTPSEPETEEEQNSQYF